MDFKPVVIKTIHDVLPHITDKPEIIQITKADYRVLDYVYSSKDTFDNPYAKECRGIKFDSEGRIIARPYHKFHNLNENPEYSSGNIDLSQLHHRLDKLDGSMCHTCLVGDKWRLMTRKGESEVALKAMAFLEANPVLKARYTELFNSMKDYTLIFEYVAPHNRIVIHYSKEQLILTGIRHIVSGFYTSYDGMVSLANAFGIPVVGLYTGKVETDKEKEGTIVRFDTGAMYKEKSPIYVRKHRSKDLVSKFKDLVKLIMDDDLDDVIPLLDDATRLKVLSYKEELVKSVGSYAESIGSWVERRSDYNQKDFAGLAQSLGSKPATQIAFQTRKTGDAFEEVKNCIKKAYGDTSRLETLFDDLKLPKFVGDFFSE